MRRLTYRSCCLFPVFFGIIIVLQIVGGEWEMSGITEEQTRKVAEMARLKLTDEEVKRFTQQLDKLIEYAEQLNELPTENVEPTSHVLELKNVMREDHARTMISREEALKNVPEQKDGLIKVPAILE